MKEFKTNEELLEILKSKNVKIYDDARWKISDVLVNGKTLKIEGGNYHLCDNMPHGKYCNRKNCKRFND